MAIGKQAARKGEGPYLRQRNAELEAQGLETSVKVWELKKSGLSFRQIAEALGMSKGGVHEAYKRVIKRLKEDLSEHADDWLHLHIGRLEDVVAFQIKVMKGLDVRPSEVKARERKAAEGRGQDPTKLEPPITSLPTIEERLMAAREVVKTGESLRKLLGIDAPEKSELDVRTLVGTVDLTELAGKELLQEAAALREGLKTRLPEEVQQLVEGSNGNLVPEASKDAKAQP